MAGASVGLIRHDFIAALRGFPNIFRIDSTVTFLPEGPTAARSEVLQHIVHSLSLQGAFSVRGESYPVTTGWGDEILAGIDRGASQYFGTFGYGVHVNGLVRKGESLHLWVAKRAGNRQVAPGKLDNIIGGGLGAGYTAREVLIKEAKEEAGLEAAVAAQAIPTGQITYVYDAPGGAKRETLFVYDLYMPEDLLPVNTDGEVERFDLWPVEEVAARVRDGDDFKLNVNAVIIDLLIRLGYLAPDMPGYERLVNGLRRC